MTTDSATPTLRITHLYPKRMSIYGDRGNIITLTRRCEWRGLAATVTVHEVGDSLPAETDLFFFGGGQDQEQTTVADDLRKNAAALREAAQAGVVFLAICGGYQLLGTYYQPASGVGEDAQPEERIEGVGVFDAWTDPGPKRLIGNVVAESALPELGNQPLVGFENHAGLTRLGPNAQPLGKVITGYGNNGEDGTEGCVTGNAVGTYLHGSLLPKNPHLADWLLTKAFQRTNPDLQLSLLEDESELTANKLTAGRFA